MEHEGTVEEAGVNLATDARLEGRGQEGVSDGGGLKVKAP